MSFSLNTMPEPLMLLIKFRVSVSLLMQDVDVIELAVDLKIIPAFKVQK